MLSFSGKVNLENVRKAVNCDNKRIIELTLENPYDDFLKSKSQLDQIMTEYRKIQAELESLGITRCHLFAAIPISVAINIGQAYNPNYSIQLETYDYAQGVYTKTLSIGEIPSE